MELFWYNWTSFACLGSFKDDLPLFCLCFDLNQLTLTSPLFTYLPINTASPKPQWTHAEFAFSELQFICSSQVNSFFFFGQF